MSFERRHAPLKHDHAASEITYDNTTSGLTADDVQAAIDEVVASSGGGTIDVEDEGTPVVAADTLNFTGDGVTVTDVGGVATIDIPTSVQVYAGAMTLVDQTTVAGADATTVSFSGLDLDTDEEYVLEWEIENPTGSSTDISLYYNADTTAGNYDRQGFSANSTTLTGARVATAVLVDIVAGTTGHCRIHIKRGPDGIVRGLYEVGRRLTTTVNWFAGTHTWETPDTNVTGITLSASTASSIGIGSKITLYKISAAVDAVSIPNEWTFTGDVIFDGDRRGAELKGATPSIYWNETDGPADEKLWEFIASGGALALQTRTDADGVGAAVLQVTRTGTVVDQIDFSSTALITGFNIPVTAVQESDLVITSNNVFQDTDLVVPLSAGKWAIEVFCEMDVNATPDLEIQLDFTGTETNFACLRQTVRGTTQGAEQSAALPFATTFAVTAVSVTQYVGTITVTVAGDFKVQVRQVTSSATSVTFYEGAWMRCTRLS